MATVTPTIERFTAPNSGGGETGDVRVITWANMSTGDTITNVNEYAGPFTQASVHTSGTFGGATVTLTGSNTGTNYLTLEDATGTPISTTTETLVEFSSTARNIVPAITGGTGDSVTVTIVAWP